MFKVIKESYLNESDNFYSSDFINLTNVISNKISLGSETKFLDRKLKNKMNSEELIKKKDAVYLIGYKGIYYLVMDYIPNLNTTIKTHELTLPDTIQGMARNLHYYNSETAPILVGIKKHASVQTYCKNVPINYVYNNSFVNVNVYTDQSAKTIVDRINLETQLFLLDGHHRLYVTEKSRIKKSMLTAVVSLEDINIDSFYRVIRNYPDSKFEEVIEKLQATGRLSQENNISKGTVQIVRNDKALNYKLIDYPNDAFQNNDIYRLNYQVISQIFGIKNLKEIEYYKDKPELGVKDVMFLTYPMDKCEFVNLMRSNGIMAPKSTLFNPKIPSNLVIKKWR